MNDVKTEKYNLLFGDCLERLKEIPDHSVDCVITDPPYGIKESAEKNLSRRGKVKGTNYKSYDWDNSKITKNYFTEIFRISKKQVFFGANYYTDLLPQSDGWCVWDKRCSDRMNNDLSDGELIWTSEKHGLRIIRHLWNGMIQQDMRRKEKRVHPTQKPTKVIEYLLNKYTKEGDTICDPFMGSGTTGVVCMKLNRTFIGIEIDEDYFRMAEKRIKNESKNTRLEFFSEG